jgi:outer membrane protein TolC
MKITAKFFKNNFSLNFTAIFNIVLIVFLIAKSQSSMASKAQENLPLKDIDVYNSALKHYPEILKFYEKISASQGDVQSSLGLFDIKLKGGYQDKTRGFYDGKISDISLEKQNAFLGSKFYGGYRKSYGNFADYDGNNLTNSQGEYRIGGSVSILRNRGIDNNRFDLILSELQLQENQNQLEKIQLEVKRDAIKSYYNWLIAGHIYKTYLELYELAKKRQQQLEIRHKKGDIAKIILTENERNILKRNSLMLEAKNDFINSSIAMSLYYRNPDSLPIIANENQLPNIDFLKEDFTKKNLDQDLQFALENRPELKILKIKISKEQTKLNLAKNLYQPKLDLSFEASKDLGNGTKSRSQSNNQVKIDFELPIQQNVAKGKILESSSQINFLKIDENFYRDKISNEIKEINNSLQTMVIIFQNYFNEYKLSHILEIAEKERFKQGNSDFFLINLREQEVATAKINKLLAFLKYQSLNADYQVAIFKK